MKLILALLSVFIFQNSAARHSTQKKPCKQAVTIKGFKVFVFVDSISEPGLAPALQVLTEKLAEISGIVPAKQLRVLRKVPIWIEYKFKPDGAMWYHKSRAWVIEHGYPGAIAKCAEICNIKNFLAWQKLNQPYMVLHELAHACHDRFLGSDNAEVQQAYQTAVQSKKYESVDFNSVGKKEPMP